MAHFKENQLAILTCTTETNTHSFCLENKLAADNYGRIIIKKPYKNQAFFVAAQNFCNIK